MRVNKHPILGDEQEQETIRITVDGRTIQARKGESIAAAMLAEKLRTCRHTARLKEARGLFCGIGQCTDCVMQVNGGPNVRTCITEVQEGMVVRTQEGVGTWEDQHESF